MSGPGDKEWERRRAVIHGQPAPGTKKGDEPAPGAGASTADTNPTSSFTGDGPAGASVGGAAPMGDDKDDDGDKKKS